MKCEKQFIKQYVEDDSTICAEKRLEGVYITVLLTVASDNSIAS